jgi:hypothetical protein
MMAPVSSASLRPFSLRALLERVSVWRPALTHRRAMARIMATMARRQPYNLIYARGLTNHLASIDAKYDRLIRETIEEQLRFEPNVETRNRKPLRQPAPFGATWEIRFGPDNRFRVLYDIAEEQRAVQILAVGEKEGNRHVVGGEEVGL